MGTESRLSAWARRGAVLAAALASIATSQARWNVIATVPAGTRPAASGTRMTVEASEAPRVTAQRKQDGAEVQPPREESTPWAGRGTYYLPPGFVPEVSLEGRCSGGMCTPCTTPPDAYARILGLDVVAPWSLSATSDELPVRSDAPTAYLSFVVRVEASRHVELEAVPTGGDGAQVRASVWRDVAPAGTGDGGAQLQRFTVSWYAADARPPSAVAPSWIARATIYGFCPDAGECRAPSGQSVRIVSMTPR